MSEFYSQRRTSIKDGVGLVGFIFGWFAAAPFAWPYIADGFDGGDPAMGVLRLVLVIFAVGIAAGAGGLILGAGAGLAWERGHRWRRGSRPEAIATTAGTAAETPEAPAAPRTHSPPAHIRFETAGINAAAYVALAVATTGDTHDATRADAALARSVNIDAWDGDRLVGVARMLTDGHYFAALANILVDREYQRHGLGRELMNRAYAATPRGALAVVARPGTTAFFERIGCERGGGSTGFTMRQPAR